MLPRIALGCCWRRADESLGSKVKQETGRLGRQGNMEDRIVFDLYDDDETGQAVGSRH